MGFLEHNTLDLIAFKKEIWIIDVAKPGDHRRQRFGEDYKLSRSEKLN